MAGCKAQEFTGITAETFACLQAKGSAAGVPITGERGQATAKGITVRWAFNPAAETLAIECLDAPFLVPCSLIASRVTELVEGCRPQAG